MYNFIPFPLHNQLLFWQVVLSLNCFMKIRILGNRVRLRLSQSEVAQIGRLESVEESTNFGENTFSYVLAVHEMDQHIHANYEGGSIQISIPKAMAQNWADSDEVGIQTPSDYSPFILIEKDFKCLTVREGEDESDMFYNPNSTC